MQQSSKRGIHLCTWFNVLFISTSGRNANPLNFYQKVCVESVLHKCTNHDVEKCQKVPNKQCKLVPENICKKVKKLIRRCEH